MNKFENIGKKLLQNVPKKAKPYIDYYVKIYYYKFKKFFYYGQKDLPLSVNIETNSLCTRSCYYCPRQKGKNDLLEEDVFYSIIDQLKEWGFKGVISLHSYNEPLTDKRIFGFLTYIHNQLKYSEIVLYTNGDLLTPQTLKKIIDAGTSELKVSIHEPTPMEFAAILETFEKQYNMISLIDFRYGQRIVSLSNRGGLIELGKIKKFKKCYKIEKMIIRADGNVVLCCEDAHEKHIFGNVKQDSLNKIWNLPQFKKNRQDIKAGNFELNICQKCGYSD